jgi:putative ABC transport system permease protein
MYIIKNALKNILRSKGRNVLIAIIIVTITGGSCVALAIQNSAWAAKDSGLSGKKITAQIQPDMNKVMETRREAGPGPGPNGGGRSVTFSASNIPSLSVDEYTKYAEISGVDDFYYTEQVNVNKVSDDFVPYTEDSSASAPSGEAFRIGTTNDGDFSLRGYSSPSAMTEFSDGSTSMLSGEIFSFDEDKTNEIIISSELATMNDTKVGDVIELANPHKASETYKLTVVGIYKAVLASGVTLSGSTSGSLRPQNAIYTSGTTLNQIVEESNQNPVTSQQTNGLGQSQDVTSKYTSQISSTYVFTTQKDYNEFNEQARAIGLSDQFEIVSEDVKAHEETILPLVQLGDFALTLLIIILIVGAIVLITLNLFNIRERKYEVGVLTAIGMRKGKVVLQFAVELLVVTLIGTAVGAGIGSAVAAPVSDSLLASQIAQDKAKQEQEQSMFGRTATPSRVRNINPARPFDSLYRGQAEPSAEELTSAGATVNLTVLLELLLIGLGLSLIGSIGGTVFVTRFEPLQILADRS